MHRNNVIKPFQSQIQKDFCQTMLGDQWLTASYCACALYTISH